MFLRLNHRVSRLPLRVIAVVLPAGSRKETRPHVIFPSGALRGKASVRASVLCSPLGVVSRRPRPYAPACLRLQPGAESVGGRPQEQRAPGKVLFQTFLRSKNGVHFQGEPWIADSHQGGSEKFQAV